MTWTQPDGAPLSTGEGQSDSTQLTASVQATDVPDEGATGTGTTAYRVSVTGGGAAGPVNFLITDADVITATTGPSITATEGVPITPTTLATFTDTYNGQSASEFKVSSVNWGDGTTQTTFSPAPTITIDNNTGIITVGGISHTYTDRVAPHDGEDGHDNPFVGDLQHSRPQQRQ